MAWAGEYSSDNTLEVSDTHEARRLRGGTTGLCAFKSSMATMASICMFFSCANFSYLCSKKLGSVRFEAIPYRHLFDKATCKRVRYPCLRRTFAVRREEQPKTHEEILVIPTIVLPGYLGVFVTCLGGCGGVKNIFHCQFLA